MAATEKDKLYGIVILGLVCSTLAVLLAIFDMSTDGCASFLCHRQLFAGILVTPSFIYFFGEVRGWKHLSDKEDKLERDEAEVREDIRQNRNDLRQAAERCAGLLGLGVVNNLINLAESTVSRLAASWPESRFPIRNELRDDLRDVRIEAIYLLDVLTSGLWMTSAAGRLRDNCRIEINKCTSPHAVCTMLQGVLPEFTRWLQGRLPETLPETLPGNLAIEMQARAEDGGGQQRTGAVGDVLLPTQGGIGWLRCCQEETGQAARIEAPLYTCKPLCFELDVLSKPHLILLLTFVFDVPSIIFEIGWQRPWSTIMLISNFCCVASTLVFFTSIDKVEHLKKRQIQLNAERHESEQDKENVKNWNRSGTFATNFQRRTRLCLKHIEELASQPDSIQGVSKLILAHASAYGEVATWDESEVPADVVTQWKALDSRLRDGGGFDPQRWAAPASPAVLAAPAAPAAPALQN